MSDLDVIDRTMYARDVDGTGSLHACSQEDDGAIKFVEMDAVIDILQKVRMGEIDNDMRCVIAHVKTID